MGDASGNPWDRDRNKTLSLAFGCVHTCHDLLQTLPTLNLCFTWRFVFAGCFGMKAGLHSAIIHSLMGGWRKPAEYNLSFAAFYKSTFDF